MQMPQMKIIPRQLLQTSTDLTITFNVSPQDQLWKVSFFFGQSIAIDFRPKLGTWSSNRFFPILATHSFTLHWISLLLSIILVAEWRDLEDSSGEQLFFKERSFFWQVWIAFSQRLTGNCGKQLELGSYESNQSVEHGIEADYGLNANYNKWPAIIVLPIYQKVLTKFFLAKTKDCSLIIRRFWKSLRTLLEPNDDAHGRCISGSNPRDSAGFWSGIVQVESFY